MQRPNIIVYRSKTWTVSNWKKLASKIAHHTATEWIAVDVKNNSRRYAIWITQGLARLEAREMTKAMITKKVTKQPRVLKPPTKP